MSLFDKITRMPAAMFDETISIEEGRTFATVSGMSALKCVFEPVSSKSPYMMFALQQQATHIVHLQLHKPTIASGMRVKKGTEYYPVLRAFHDDGQFSVLLVQGTSAKV